LVHKCKGNTETAEYPDDCVDESRWTHNNVNYNRHNRVIQS